jgi:bifunctional non-homologous end joining protein LigD
VGSGFDESTQNAIFQRLQPLVTSRMPFDARPATREKSTWVAPELVASVKFNAWTHDQHLRAPVFLGLRFDVEPSACQWDSVMPSPQAAAPPPERIQPGHAAEPARTEPASHRRAKASKPTFGLEQVLFEDSPPDVTVDVQGRTLKLTNLNKVYFPEPGLSKRNLLAHYYRVSPYILPFLQDRPLVLHRFPNGVTGEPFYQQNMRDSLPEWMDHYEEWSESSKELRRYAVCNELAALLYLTNLGCIEHNPWSTRRQHPDQPDYLFFDLDPTDDTPFSTVVQVAKATAELVKKLGVTPYLKTSGASGFHIYLPLKPRYSFEQIRMLTEIIFHKVQDRLPALVTFERSVAKRPKGRVYMDYLQNASGHPLASVYSARPKPRATVSTPVQMKELTPRLDPLQFTLETTEARLKKVGDLWSGFWKDQVTLEQAMEGLEKV